MDLLLDILQGAGLAAAAGVAPLPAAIVAGGLAAGNAGLDFDHSRYAFLESPVFLAALAVVFVAVALLGGRGGGKRWTPALSAALVLASLAAGALLFAGSLADRSDAAWPGLLAGPACAWLGVMASRGVLARATARAQGTSAPVELAVDAIVAVTAALVIAAPPLTLVVVALLVRFAVAERRRSGERYAGLRVLR